MVSRWRMVTGFFAFSICSVPSVSRTRTVISLKAGKYSPTGSVSRKSPASSRCKTAVQVASFETEYR